MYAVAGRPIWAEALGQVLVAFLVAGNDADLEGTEPLDVVSDRGHIRVGGEQPRTSAAARVGDWTPLPQVVPDRERVLDVCRIQDVKSVAQSVTGRRCVIGLSPSCSDRP